VHSLCCQNLVQNFAAIYRYKGLEMSFIALDLLSLLIPLSNIVRVTAVKSFDNTIWINLVQSNAQCESCILI